MGWQVKKLGDICRIELGKTPSRSNRKYWDETKSSCNVWLSIADLPLSLKPVMIDSKEYITDEGASLCKVVPKDTLIVSFKLSLGRLAFTGRDLFTNEAIAALYINDVMEVNQEYLYWFLTFFDWDAAVGSDIKVKGKTLNKAKLKEIEVLIPSLSEQKRIVAILDEVFADIEQARAKTQQNLKNARELFESYLQQVFSQLGGECALRLMSDKSMLTMVDGDRGKNYPQKSDFYTSGYCLFLSTKNVRPNGFLFDETVFIDEHRDNLLGKGKLAMNDVILTTRGTIGNLALLDESVEYENIRINSGMLILRPNTQVLLPSYLFEIMRSGIVKRQIEDKVSGAAQPQLPIKTLNTFSFPVPASLELQREVVNKIKVFEASINGLAEIYEEKLNSLTELKQSILHKAFSGQLTQTTSKEEVA